MPWHLSKSDSRKVYDERHQTVCVCQTAEQAARIVAAITGQPETIRLREPSVEGGFLSGYSLGTAETHPPNQPLNTFEPDECCGPHLSRALRNQPKHLQSWACPKCGCEWESQERGAVRHWSPVSAVAIFGGRR